MLKDMLKVAQIAKESGVSQVTIYKKLKKLNKQLKGCVIKKQGATFITKEGIKIIKHHLNPEKINAEKGNEKKTFNPEKEVKRSLKDDLIEAYKSQIEDMKVEMKRKDDLLNKVVDDSAKNQERSDTIIMKMTNDLEQVRSENRLFLEESKKKEEVKKPETKKTDRVISIQEFINAKIEEDIERSNYEVEKKRLKKKNEEPLHGKSALYKIYVKMFRPEKLRKNIS
ncbi:hypothetical protein KAJ27_07395 [bacterium]|nr:hypothetical protein [bacterium]